MNTFKLQLSLKGLVVVQGTAMHDNHQLPPARITVDVNKYTKHWGAVSERCKDTSACEDSPLGNFTATSIPLPFALIVPYRMLPQFPLPINGPRSTVPGARMRYSLSGHDITMPE